MNVHFDVHQMKLESVGNGNNRVNEIYIDGRRSSCCQTKGSHAGAATVCGNKVMMMVNGRGCYSHNQGDNHHSSTHHATYGHTVRIHIRICNLWQRHWLLLLQLLLMGDNLPLLPQQQQHPLKQQRLPHSTTLDDATSTSNEGVLNCWNSLCCGGGLRKWMI